MVSPRWSEWMRYLGGVIIGGMVATGDRENLSIGEVLSAFYFSIPENNFSFFDCHARKPYSHKGFPAIPTGKQSGKNFSPGRQFRRLNSRKARERNGKERKEREGREGREGRAWNECSGNLFPFLVKYPKQSGSAFPFLC